MIPEKVISKLNKQDDIEIIKDILKANGITECLLSITEQNTKGITRLSISYKSQSGEHINSILNRDENFEFVEYNTNGTKKTNSKFKENPKKEPEGILNTTNYVGDSTKLYETKEDVVGETDDGKPVRKSFRETHEKRIMSLLWEIANQKADPTPKLTKEEQRKLEENLGRRRY